MNARTIKVLSQFSQPTAPNPVGDNGFLCGFMWRHHSGTRGIVGLAFAELLLQYTGGVCTQLDRTIEDGRLRQKPARRRNGLRKMRAPL
jgi:hypothetical protein